MSNPNEFDALPLEERIALRGVCPKLNCRESNRFKAKYCKEHMYTRRAKCSFTDCGNYSLSGKDGTCSKHSTSKPPKKQLECSRCLKIFTTLLSGKCRACVSKTPCIRCLRPGAMGVEARGGRCTLCPLPVHLRCTQVGCHKHRFKEYFCERHFNSGNRRVTH